MAEQTIDKSSKLISLAEASKQTGYHQDYLGFLCRQGKLKGFKVGRNWVTTQEGLDEFLKSLESKPSTEKVISAGNETQISSTPVKQPIFQPEILHSADPVQPAEQTFNKLALLKNEVFSNLEDKVKRIEYEVEALESSVKERTAEIQKERAGEKKNESAGLEGFAILGSAPVQGKDLRNQFSPALHLEHAQIQQETEFADSKQKENKKTAGLFAPLLLPTFYKSFNVKGREISKFVWLSLSGALLVFAGLLLYASSFLAPQFSGQQTKIIYQNAGSQSYVPNQNSQALQPSSSPAQIIVIQNTQNQNTANQLLGYDNTALYSLIDNRLNQYLAEGKFKGDKGDTGPEGIQGPQGPAGASGGSITYLQPAASSGGNPGSLSGVTYFSADQLTANHLTVTGTSNFIGATTFNGVTYTWPSGQGGSGQSLVNDGSGNLSWSTVSGGGGGSGNGTVATGTPGAFAYYGGTVATVSPQSVLFLSGSSIGIGTSTPDQTLTVYGGFNVATGSTQTLLVNTASQKVTVQNLTIAGLTGSTQCLHVDASGNVTGTGLDCGVGGGTLSGGTRGYVATWASSTGLTIGTLIDNGTVAGVNATSSSYTFNLQGTSGVNPLNIASSTGSQLLVVNQNGNVGIGTSSPDGLLTVYNTGARPSLKVVNPDDSQYAVIINNTSYGSTDSTGFGLWQESNGDAVMDVLGVPRMFISTVGNVGIGNWHDANAASSTRFSIMGRAGGYDVLDIASSGGASILRVTNNLRVGIGSTSPNATLVVQGTSTYGSVSPFVVASSSGSQLLTVLPSGNVGIGTSTAVSEKLVVQGNILTLGEDNPVLVNSTSTSAVTANTPWKTYIYGQYAFVTFVGSSTGTFAIYNISNQAKPVLLGATTTPSLAYDVVASGNYAYVASRTGSQIYIYDISNPATMVLKSTFNSGAIFTMAIAGKYLVAVTQSSQLIEMIDISNPISPVVTNTLDTGLFFPRGLSVSGKYAYVTGYNGSNLNRLSIFDISNPYAIAAHATTSINLPNAGDRAFSNYVSGNYVYVSNWNASTGSGTLSIFDVRDPDNIVARGTITTNVGSSQRVIVSGKYAYLANGADSGSSTISVYDISDPDNIVPKGVSASVSGGNFYDMAISGKYAYVADSGNSGALEAYELNSIETPNLATGNINAGFGNFTGSLKVGNYLNVQGGLSVGPQGALIGGDLTVQGSGSSSFYGKLGIGTSTPSSTFYVLGSGSTTPLTISSSTGTSLFTIAPNGSTTLSSLGTGLVRSSNGSLYTDTATYLQAADLTNYIQYSYASSTFPSFTYASNTFATIANYPTYTYASSTYATTWNLTAGSNITITTSTPGQITIASSGGLSGSGTTGKLAVWNGASSLTTGLFLDNGTVAGVNATSSSITFNLQGSAGANDIFDVSSSTGVSVLRVTNNQRVGIGSTSPTATLVVQGTSTSPTLPVFTVASSTGSQLLTVLANGNVGVGNITPNYKLTVAGPTTLISDNGTLSGSAGILSIYKASASPGDVLLSIGSNQQNDQLKILAAQAVNFGVYGITAGNLYVGQNAQDIDRIVSSQNTNNYIDFFNTVNGEMVLQTGNVAGYDIVFKPGATERMRLTRTGNVGINTSTPTATLHVQGIAGTTSPLTIASSSGTSLFTIAPNGSTTLSSLGTGLVRSSNGSLYTDTATYLQAADLTNYIQYSYASSTFPSFTYASNTFATILNYPSYAYGSSTYVSYSYGSSTYATIANYPTYTYASSSYATTWNLQAGSNITITTSTPGQITIASSGGLSGSGSIGKLAVWNGASSLTNSILLDNGTVAGVNATSSTITFNLQGTAGANDIFNVSSSTGISVLRVTNNQRVGIGSSTPIATLTVQGTFTYGSIYPLVVASSTGSQLLVINPSGYVGINTSVPSTLLSVSGEALAQYFTAYATNSTTTLAGGLNVSNGAINYDWSSGQTSIQNLALGSMSFDTDAGQINWVDLPVTASSSTSTINSYTAQIDGNPLLTVYSEADGSGGIQNSAVGVGTTTPLARFSVQGAADGNALIDFASSTGISVLRVTANQRVGIGSTSPTATLVVQGTSTSPTLPVFAVASSTGSQLLTVLANGNVGVGVANPSFKLEVNGNLSLDGSNLYANAWFDSSNNNYFLDPAADSGYSALLAGKVGIGTTTPTATLHVQGIAGSTSPLTVSSSTGTSLFTIAPNGSTTISSLTAGLVRSTSGGSLYVDNSTYLTSALTSISALTGPSIHIATTTDTNITISVNTSTANTLTFVPGFTGTLAAARLNSNVVQGITNDTNITGSISAQNLTLGWTGQLSVARGGTGTSTLGDLTVSSSNLSITGGQQVLIGTSTQITLTNNPSFATLTTTGNLNVGGALSVTATTTLSAATTTINGVTYYWPSSQAVGAKILQNDGSGNLSWVSDQTGGGGTLSGGTQGYVMVWASSTGATIGTLLDNGTVAGQNATSSNISFNIQGSAGNIDPFNVASSSGTSFLRVTQAGRVGIGTSSPDELLTIQDAARPLMSFKDGNGNTKAIYGISTGSGLIINNSVNGDSVFRNQGGNILFSTDSGTTAHLYIKNGGNIGIGTTTPAAKLSVTGTAGANDIFDVSSSTGISALRVTANQRVGIGSTSPTATLVVQGTSTSPTLPVFAVASSTGSQLLTVLANGNVGVGTTTPIGQLSIQGSSDQRQFVIKANSTQTSSILDVYSSSNSNILSLSNGGSLSGSGFFFNTGTVSESSGSGNTVTLSVKGNPNQSVDIFQVSNGTSLVLMNVDKNGNVGIGTSTPGYQLTVASSSTTQPTALIIATSSQTSNLLVIASSTGSSLFTIAPNGSTTLSSLGTGLVRSSSGSLYTDTNTYLTSALTSISALTGPNIHIATTTDTNITISVNTSTANTLTFVPGFTGQLSVSRGGTGASSLPSGKVLVGSGTSAITTGILLDNGTVAGVNATSSTITFNLQGTAGSNDILNIASSTGNSILTVKANSRFAFNSSTPTSLFVVQGTNTDNNTTTPIFTVASSTGSQLFTVLANGNVGVGKSNPSVTLDVTGIIAATGQITSNGYISGTYMRTTYNTDATWPAYAGGDNTTGILFPATGNLAFSTGGVERLRINSSGNLGIGTTTPGYQLTVASSSTTQPTALIIATSSQTSNLLVVASSSGTSYLTVASNGSTTLSSLGTGCVGVSSGSLYTTSCGGGSLTGSGSIGKLAVWNGVSSLTNSILLDNGTVAGVNATSSSITFNLQGTAGSNDLFNVASSTGISVLRVTNNQRVGIGSTSPNATLVVQGTSTSPTLPVFTVASSTGSQLLTVLANGNVGVGTSTPDASLHVRNNTPGNDFDLRSVLELQSNANTMVYADTFSNTFWASPFLRMRRARGTIDVPASISAGDTLARWSAQGYDGSSYQEAALILMGVDSQRTSGMPGIINFYTTPDGSNSIVQRMTINSSGNVGISTSTPTATLHVQGIAGSTNALTISSSTGTSLFTIASNGSTTISSLGAGLVRSTSGGSLYTDTNTYLTSALTSISALTGPNIHIATTTDTNITISINTSTANTLTFVPGFTGTLAAARLNSNVVQGVTNDTNITGSISAQNLTLGFTGQLSVARGGTGTSTLPTVQGQILADDGTHKYGPTTLVAGSNITITTTTPGQITFAGTSPTITAGSTATGPAFTFSTSTSGSGTLTITGSGSNVQFALDTSNLQPAGSYVTNSYASSTFPSFTYASNTFATIANYPTYTYASSTYALAANFSGTTGKLAVWSSPTALSTGLFLDNGTVAGVNATSSSITFNLQGSAGANDIFNVSSSTGISVLRVTNAGKVGINTTTPLALLGIQGVSGQTNNILNISSSSGSSLLAISSYGGLVQNISSSTAVSIQDGSGNPVFTVDTSGASGAGIDITGNSGQTAALFSVSSSSGTSFLRVLSSGNVGINTATPSSQLQVVGDIALGSKGVASASSLIFNTGSTTNQSTVRILATTTLASNLILTLPTTTPSAGNAILSDANGNLYFGAPAATLSGGTNGYVARWTSASTLSTGILFDNGSVLGVNASSSTISLNVQGSGTLDPFNVSSSTGVSILRVAANQRIGIGSSTPIATLTVQGTSTYGSIYPLVVASSTGSQLLVINPSGYVGINTSVPSSLLSVSGEALAQYFTSYATNSTTTLAGGLNVSNGAINYDWSTGQTSIQNLALGSLTFANDAGQVNWVDLPVTASSSTSTINSYTAQIDGNPLLTVYSEADGSGGIQNSAVGIGTTTPLARFSVQGAADGNALVDFASSTGISVLRVTANQRVGIGSTSPTATLVVQGTSTSPTLPVFTVASSTGSQLLTVLANGNVGIGKSNPSVTLDVTGIIAATGQITSNGYISGTYMRTTYNTDATWPAYAGGDNTTGILFPATGNLAFSTGGVERLRINSSGNLGIGTTTPGYQLTVASSSTTQPTALIIATSSQTSDLFVIASSSGTSYLTVASNGSTTLSSLGTGCVGVSSGSLYTTSCGAGSLTGSGSIGKLAVWNGASSLTNSILYDNGTVAGINATSSSVTFNLQGTAGSNDIFNVSSSTGVSVLRVTNNQRVGIGSTSPTATLVVQGTSTSPTLPVFAVASSTGSQLLTVLANGNVGVGTTTPIGQLSIQGSSDQRQFVIKANSTQTSSILDVYSSSNSNILSLSNGGSLSGSGFFFNTGTVSESSGSGNTVTLSVKGNPNQSVDIFQVSNGTSLVLMNVDKNGNVGIGTSTPTATLHVQGSGTTTPLTIASSTGSSLLTVAANGSTTLSSLGTGCVGVSSGSLYTTSCGGGSLSGSGSIGKLAVWNGASSLTNSILFDNGTVAGINATSSSYTFNLQGSSGVSPLNISSSTGTSLLVVNQAGNVGIGTTTPIEMLHIVSGNILLSNQYALRSLTTTGANAAMISIDSGNYTSVFSPLSTAGVKIKSATSQDLLTVLNGGNVGIGSSSPITKLVVDGSVNSTGANAIAGIYSSTTLQSTTNGGFAFGNRFISTITGSNTSTFEGLFVRTIDNTTATNTVRGLEVQAYSGTNTLGVNTGIAAFGKTFGVQAYTDGLAGGVAQPAALFGELGNATQGNAIRAYSATATSATLLSVYQETSAYTGDALVMDLGNGTGSFNTGNFINLKNAGTSKFRVATSGNTTIANGWLCVDNNDTCTGANTAGTVYAVGTYTTGADVAENYPTLDSLEPGDVVMAQGVNPVFVSKASTSPQVLGIVSTKPGILLNGYRSEIFQTATNVPIALSGRVPVKVTNENGPINIGDYLAPSREFPGYAMKATVSGTVIGQALESFVSDSSVASTTISSGKILTFMQIGYRNINNLFVLGPDDGQLVTATASTFTIVSSASSSDVSLLINQKGSGNILQLQAGGQDRLLIANDGSLDILASSTLATSTVLSVQNGSSTLFSINASGDAQFTGHISVGKDTAGTAVIKAGDNQVAVTFSQAYPVVPKVLISINGLPSSAYGVTEKTTQGFTISMAAQATQDTSFDWLAINQPEDNGSGQSGLNLQVVSSPAGSSGGGGSVSVNTAPADTTTAPASGGGQVAPQPDSGQVAGTSTVDTTTATNTPPAPTPTPTPTPTPAPADPTPVPPTADAGTAATNP